MPLLEDGVASSALVTAPNLAGSLTRLPASIALERFSSKSIHAFIMTLSLVGTVCLMILSFATANMETLNSGVFAGYMIFGLIGGLGVGLFSPGIATVSFWHPKSKQGSRNGLFGGVTNLAPGLFGLWIAPVMSETSIGLTYIVWIVLVAIVMAISLPLIKDSPFHQLLFRSRTMASETGARLTREQTGEIRNIAVREHGQEIFPSGDIRTTLFLSARNYRTWQLISFYIVSFGGYLGLTVYLPTFFTEEFGTSPASATLMASMFSLTAGTMRIIGGWACDKITFMHGGVFMNYVSFTLIILGSVIVVFAPTAAGALTGSLFMSVGFGVSNAATFKILPHYIHSAVAGAAGWVGAMGAFGSVVWPILMGVIASKFPHKSSFLLFLFLGLYALLMMIPVHAQLLKEDILESVGSPQVQKPGLSPGERERGVSNSSYYSADEVQKTENGNARSSRSSSRRFSSTPMLPHRSVQVMNVGGKQLLLDGQNAESHEYGDAMEKYANALERSTSADVQIEMSPAGAVSGSAKQKKNGAYVEMSRTESSLPPVCDTSFYRLNDSQKEAAHDASSTEKGQEHGDNSGIASASSTPRTVHLSHSPATPMSCPPILSSSAAGAPVDVPTTPDNNYISLADQYERDSTAVIST